MRSSRKLSGDRSTSRRLRKHIARKDAHSPSLPEVAQRYCQSHTFGRQGLLWPRSRSTTDNRQRAGGWIHHRQRTGAFAMPLRQRRDCLLTSHVSALLHLWVRSDQLVLPLPEGPPRHLRLCRNTASRQLQIRQVGASCLVVSRCCRDDYPVGVWTGSQRAADPDACARKIAKR